MTLDTAATTVKVLLDAAGLKVSDEEFLRFATVYPTIRAQADGLYLPELEDEDPALGFDPTVAV
ncbi:hypothetical protein [Actinomarinicola tropica]|uniref:Uncharacterized protein n=1 Tax=Actinomarinicola tropica TaxID=2789776 RepID=A0A5Q2RKQ0_9ACTN|nr:hypothetical protein [Actinomarinicola tropica]QGG94996.1 hypothetical protein GH723_07680 [Actinomarinicola tropica]